MQTANDAGSASPATSGGSYSSVVIPPGLRTLPRPCQCSTSRFGTTPGAKAKPRPPTATPYWRGGNVRFACELQQQRLDAAEEKKERDEERREDRSRAAAIAAAHIARVWILILRIR